MVVDVHAAIANGRLEIVHTPRALTLLEGTRGILCLADAAIDDALEPDLRVVVQMRSSHVDVEQRGDVLAVYRLDLRRDMSLQASHHLGDLSLGRGGDAARWH